MATDVEKAAQHSVVSSQHENRLAGYFTGDVLTWLANLIDAPDHLPHARKDRPLL